MGKLADDRQPPLIQAPSGLPENPMVTVIVPCRNEERFIGPCLDSLVAGRYDPTRLEILVMDGRSRDRTAQIVGDYSRRFPMVRLIDNPNLTTPWAMNLGINQAVGSIIMKADAHSTFNIDYIPLAVRYLEEFKVDDVGGVLETCPGADSHEARAVACVLSSRFGTGNSYFRIGSVEPRLVDTVAYGCYRRDVFDRVGLYNTNLARSQDIDLNQRLRKAGGRIMLHPALRINYYASPNLASFFKHNFTDGEWAILPVVWGSFALSPRHLAPMAMVILYSLSGILAIFYLPALWTFSVLVVAYFGAALYFSLGELKNRQDPGLTPYILVAYYARHFGYGLGSVWGVLKVLTSGSAWRRVFSRRKHVKHTVDGVNHA